MDTLLFYDGPKLFSFKNPDGKSWLAYYLDDGDKGELFLATPVDEQTLTGLKESRVPIREALLRGTTLVVAEVLGESVLKAMTILKADIPDDFLPKASQLLPLALKHLKLAIKLSSRKFDMIVLQRVLGPIQRMIARAAEGISQSSPRLVPTGSRKGSFILDVEIGKDSALSGESFVQAWKNVTAGPAPSNADDWAELATILEDEKASLVIDLSSPSGSIQKLELTRSQLSDLMDKIRDANKNRSVKLTSAEVPQANDIEKMLLLVCLKGEKSIVEPREIGVGSARQVKYYVDAAALMGLLDGGWPTPIGRQISKLDGEKRYPVMAMLFESSRIGQAWLVWSGSKTLLDLETSSAQKFLTETTSGLSADTIKRRASTMRTWADTLKQHHYLLNSIESVQ